MPDEFTVKDSGERESFSSGMVRDTTEGKARWDLLLVDGLPYEEQMLTRLAVHLTKGAKKYEARNWEKADTPVELARSRESAFRHLMQYLCGKRDEDHAAAVIFNLMEAELVEYRLAESKPGVRNFEVTMEGPMKWGSGTGDGHSIVISAGAPLTPWHHHSHPDMEGYLDAKGWKHMHMVAHRHDQDGRVTPCDSGAAIDEFGHQVDP
jgi:Domain of unknown function (DUF5664)